MDQLSFGIASIGTCWRGRRWSSSCHDGYAVQVFKIDIFVIRFGFRIAIWGQCQLFCTVPEKNNKKVCQTWVLIRIEKIWIQLGKLSTYEIPPLNKMNEFTVFRIKFNFLISTSESMMKLDYFFCVKPLSHFRQKFLVRSPSSDVLIYLHTSATLLVQNRMNIQKFTINKSYQLRWWHCLGEYDFKALINILLIVNITVLQNRRKNICRVRQTWETMP